MEKIKYIVLSLFVSSFMISCDILDLKPLDKLSDEDVWNDPVLMQLYLSSCYNAIPHGYQDYMQGSYTDELWPRTNDQRGQDVLVGALNPDNVTSLPTHLNYWATAYSYVRKINIFLEKSQNAPLSEIQYKSMTGELRFLRAYIYSYLIWCYGGVPIITKVYQLNEDYHIPRNSYEECVNFIVRELREVKELLPDKQPDNLTGHASGDACRALIARVLLYWASPLHNPSNDRQRWEDAATAAEELIDSRYQLHDDYEKIFMEDNDEIIFARQFTQANSTNYGLWLGRSGDAGQGIFNPTQNLVNAYEMKATGKLPCIEQPDGTYLPDPASGYDPQRPYEGRDPRFYASILFDGAFWQGRETETFKGGRDHRDYTGGGSTWLATETSYYVRKFVDEAIPPTGSSNKPTNPWVFFRYTEILLNYAEAKFELGDEVTARKYVNMIRNRKSVQMPEIADTGDALKERIRHERRIELVMEPHRFFDVRRWKIAEITEKKPVIAMEIIKEEDQTKTYTEVIRFQRDFQPQHYYLPVPRAEVEKSLGSIEQNPGY
jgi:hypothetical protein